MLGSLWLFVRILLLGKRNLTMISLLLGMVITGYSWGLKNHLYRQQVTQTTEVRQHVVTIPGDQFHINGNRLTFVGRDNSMHQTVAGMAYLRDRYQVQQLQHSTMDMQITVDGQLQPLMPPTNTNQHDFRPRSYSQGISNQLLVKRVDNIRLVELSRLDVHYYRLLASRYFEHLPSPLSNYCAQLILGETVQQRDHDFQESVRRLGIIHLFCISGLHVSALVAGISLILTYCRITRETSEWLLIVLLPFYAIIGGQSVGLVRAVLMTEAHLIGCKYYQLSALDTWAVSLIGGVFINPWIFLSLGGQLSYLLSLGLQVFPKEWGNFRQSLTLNLLSLPSIVSFLYEVHWLTFITSFVMIPLFTYFVFPAVIISAITYRLLPGLASITNNLLLGIQRVLVTVSACPGMITFGKPPLIVAIGLLLVTCLTIDHHWHFSYFALGMTYLIVFIMIHYQPLGEVAFVDIGQGDSIIIRTPFNRRVSLIDTGGKLQFSKATWARPIDASNMAERTSVNYLKSKGIQRIDTIYLSHHDADHIGYLASFIKNFKVNEVVVPSGMEKQRVVRQSIEVVSKPPIVKPVVANQSFLTGLTCLHPFTVGKGNNEDSLVLWGHFGKLRFIFSGDLDQQGEQAVLHRYPCLRADVVKLGHHGSKTSSNKKYLAALHPQIGIVSAGRHNRYGHPNQETLSTLQQLRIRKLSTQQYGMIRYRFCGPYSYWTTTLKGDELSWTLKPSKSN